MYNIRVDAEGLQFLASCCASVAGQLTADVPAQLPGPPRQATSAATAATYAALTDVSVVLAARVQATGIKVGSAAASYVNDDDSPAQEIAVPASTFEA